MKLLALETATEWCSVALIRDRDLERCREEFLPREHARKLPGMVQSLVRAEGWHWEDLDGIAVSIGPGSFTGLRVGLSFAKGLAYSRHLPLVPVSTLEAMTLGWPGDWKHLGTVLYSHGEQVYYQNWTYRQDRWRDTGSPKLLTMDELFREVSPASHLVGWKGKYGGDFPASFREVRPTAKSVGLLASLDFDLKKVERPFELTPNYIAAFPIHSR